LFLRGPKIRRLHPIKRRRRVNREAIVHRIFLKGIVAETVTMGMTLSMGCAIKIAGGVGNAAMELITT
jgi:hypothetical protein